MMCVGNTRIGVVSVDVLVICLFYSFIHVVVVVVVVVV
jgi:hypothetical protein